MENKKALLIKETGGLIIAVILLVLLVFGVNKGWTQVVEDEGHESAETLSAILQKSINDFLDSEEKNNTISIKGVNADAVWFLTAYDKRNPSPPDKCFVENCFCISPQQTAESCQSAGSIIKIELEKIEAKTISSKEVGRIDSLGGERALYIRTGKFIKCSSPSIPLPSLFMDLELVKVDNSLTINYYDESYSKNKQNIVTNDYFANDRNIILPC